MLTSIIIVTVLHIAGFLYGYIFRSDKFTDFTYSLGFILLAGASLLANPNTGIVHVILAAMVIIWGFRLGGYLFYRIHKMGRDERFDEMHKSWISYGKFWVLQLISILIISLPFLIVLSKPELNLNTLVITGTLIWLAGWILESISDQQKLNFYLKRKSKEEFIQSGLWGVSRHPNYFGEILCWIGIFFFCIPFLSGLEWIAIIGPLWIFILLRYISGIPLLEESADKKYGHLEKYKSYKKEVSLFIPFL